MCKRLIPAFVFKKKLCDGFKGYEAYTNNEYTAMVQF